MNALSPKDVIEMTKATGLRGRGGAGFPTATELRAEGHWKTDLFVLQRTRANLGPGRDRVIMERDPHQLIEGIIIAAYAVDCHLAFIYIRGEFSQAIACSRRLWRTPEPRDSSVTRSSGRITTSTSFCTGAGATSAAKKRIN